MFGSMYGSQRTAQPSCERVNFCAGNAATTSFPVKSRQRGLRPRSGLYKGLELHSCWIQFVRLEHTLQNVLRVSQELEALQKEAHTCDCNQ